MERERERERDVVKKDTHVQMDGQRQREKNIKIMQKREYNESQKSLKKI